MDSSMPPMVAAQPPEYPQPTQGMYQTYNSSGHGRGKGRSARGRGKGKGRSRGRGGYGRGRGRGRGKGKSRGGGYGSKGSGYGGKGSGYGGKQGKGKGQTRITTASITDHSVPHSDDNCPILTVARTSDPKSVAGSIAHCIRDESNPILLAGCPASINQAVKAVIIARQYLCKENMDCRATPEYQGNTSSLRIYITKAELPTPDLEYSEISVNSNSDPYKVAGAVSKRIRQGELVAVETMGPQGVFHAMETVAVSRSYLSTDGLELQFTAEFYQRVMQGESRDAVYIYLHSYPAL